MNLKKIEKKIIKFNDIEIENTNFTNIEALFR